MDYKRTTHVPNILFDFHFKRLSKAELKILLIVIRQTHGWIDTRTGRRKERDWITQNQFVRKTGLSRQSISKTVGSLHDKGYIIITNQQRTRLTDPKNRRGQQKLFYQLGDLELVKAVTETCKENDTGDVNSVGQYKTNSTRLKKTKGFESLKSVISRLFNRW